jgi:hypothetical protein
MKYAFLVIAAIAALFVVVPTSAEARDYCAGDRRIIRYDCGRPVYAVYQIVGRDHWGRPIGRWVTVSSYGGGYGRSRYPAGYGYGGGYGYGYGRPSCPPPYYGRSGGGVHFSVGW